MVFFAKRHALKMTYHVALDDFHSLLTQTLQERHNTHAVHNISELKYLCFIFR